MKKNHFIFMAIAFSTLVSCSVKSTGSKTSTVANPIGTGTGISTGGSGTGTGTGGTTVTSCDGVPRDGATRCYYKNIPTVQASGGTYGQTWWSSTNFIAQTGNSPNQFSTDATFNVRIVAKPPTASATSTFGKTCSPYMMYATKLKVQVMLHKQGTSVGEVATLTAPLNSASGAYHFTVPASAQPLVMEVINVQSDSRCNPKPGSTTQSYYGSIPSSCASNPYLDIPINSAGPTECVAFDLQYSTDETYDLPN